METEYKIHTGYVFFILIAIIIGLVTVKWSEIPKLVDYLTFALTATSLALAVLAIVYAMYSNTSFSQTISTLDFASH